MAKDPAFLFYASDFLTGTMFFSDAQVGKYIRLLCSQHQHGGLIDKHAFDAIVGDDKLLRSKFEQTENGYYNIRLSTEMELRSKKSANISEAAKETWKKRKESNTIVIQSYKDSNTIPIRTEDEDENENKDDKEVKKEIIPELPEFLNVGEFCCKKAKLNFDDLKYCIELKYHAWKSDGWKDGHGKKIKNWKTKLGNTIPYLKPIPQPKDTWAQKS